ncbi:hypothetical protein ACTFIY_006081 [Dictyostelium cf. discoideum]
MGRKKKENQESLKVKSIGVKVSKSSEKKKIKRKKNFSNFHLTINTNQKPSSDSEAERQGEILNRALDRLYNDETHRQKLFIVTKNITLPPPEPGEQPAPLTFFKSHFTYSIEIGKKGKGGRVHSHTLIETVHNSYIQINTEYIRTVLPSMIGVDSVYVNVKVVGNGGGTGLVMDYIKKDQESESDEE